MPFAGYKDFADCTSKNQDKGDPDAYCGSIKHKVEDKARVNNALSQVITLAQGFSLQPKQPQQPRGVATNPAAGNTRAPSPGAPKQQSTWGNSPFGGAGSSPSASGWVKRSLDGIIKSLR